MKVLLVREASAIEPSRKEPRYRVSDVPGPNLEGDRSSRLKVMAVL